MGDLSEPDGLRMNRYIEPLIGVRREFDLAQFNQDRKLPQTGYAQ